GETTLLAGGRGIDQNGDGTIGVNEGFLAVRPFRIIADRDTNLQTAADLMGLVGAVRAGMDADGDGQRDLDPSRISHLGTSQGGFYGAPFLAVEPGVPTGILNVTGGTLQDLRRLAPGSRPDVGSLVLRSRTPPLLNPPGLAAIGGVPVAEPRFDENVPLR